MSVEKVLRRLRGEGMMCLELIYLSIPDALIWPNESNTSQSA